MSWLGLVVLVLALYLAFKVASALLKIVLFVVMLVAAYWFAAPMLGLPSVSDLFYVLGPDFGGKRIEELAQPAAIADHVARQVTDGVVERVAAGLPEAAGAPDSTAPPAPTHVDAIPEPLQSPLPEPLPAQQPAGESALGER
jgi:hypothetical protein